MLSDAKLFLESLEGYLTSTTDEYEYALLKEEIFKLRELVAIQYGY